MNIDNIHLAEWQQNFVDKFEHSNNQRNMLIAATGTGKTITSMCAAHQKLRSGKSKKLIILTDRLMLRDQWKYVANQYEINLTDDASTLLHEFNNGMVITYQSLRNEDRMNVLLEQASNGGLLIIVDEVHRSQKQAAELCDRVLQQNISNQCLFISRTPLIGQSVDWTYEFGKEFLIEPNIIEQPENKIQIVRYSPSIGLLQQFWQQAKNLDNLNWRQFEILVSRLLESDGYEVQLMSGTKDGGVDIVAVKDLGEHGMFKALWQAKKYNTFRKVGIDTIRELADVRNEYKASKGIIVTSSFLTSGALQRVERDQYILGKVDRNDLNEWIDRKLYE